MDIVQTITNTTTFDWLVIGFCVLMFVVGFAQGVIRRLLGIASIAFSFLLAANLRDSLGSYLADSWTQFPREYSYMLSFGIMFILSSVIFAIVIQTMYKRTPILAKWPIVDELLGGVLGVVEALLIVGCGIAIMDSFFRLPVGIGDQQIGQLKDLYGALNASGTAAVFRDSLIPIFVAVTGPLMPSDIRALYPRT